MLNHYINLVVEERPDQLYELIESYLRLTREHLYRVNPVDAKRECLSGLNRFERIKRISSVDENVYVNVGDIVYADFGQAYINEAGFQHFGLVVAMFNYKAFVIPMSSNRVTLQKAPNYPGCGESKTHLYYIGQPSGMNKESVLFLNDGKFINTARVIEIKSKIDPQSPLFLEIREIYRKMFE